MWEAFAKPTHTFSVKNISVYATFNDQSFNDTLTNDIVSFEQLGQVRHQLNFTRKCSRLTISEETVCWEWQALFFLRSNFKKNVVCYSFTYHFKKKVNINNWLCWGLTTRQPLRVILCRLQEKGRKEIRRESRGDEREGQGRKRNRNESEETEEI